MSRTALAAFIGLAFCVASSRADAPKSESLKEFVSRNKTRHAVGLYLQNKKVGWLVVDVGLGTHQGQEAALETTEMLLSLAVDGEKTVVRQRERVVYSLVGDGPIIFAEQTETQDGKVTVHTAVPSGTEITVETKVGGSVSKRTAPLPKANLAQARQLMQWLSGVPKSGATFEHWAAEWDGEEIDSKETFTFVGKKSILWGGLKTDVYQVKVDMKGAIFEAEVLANGNPIRGKLAVFELRAESEEVAKRLDKGTIDMIKASSIEVDRNLGDSKSVSGLTLQVEGLKELKLPESHRQRLRRDGERILLDLREDFRVEQPVTLGEAERKRYTAATPTVQCDNAKVKKLAAEIVGTETDALKKADKIRRWVYAKLKKTMANNSTTTLGVLDTMAGDCTEHTLLFVSLARAAGIPARELTGVAHVDKIFGWHAWAEIHDGHQWVSVDPTWNELYVDATHIVFSHDNKDHAWLNVLGNLSFKAVKIERRE